MVWDLGFCKPLSSFWFKYQHSGSRRSPGSPGHHLQGDCPSEALCFSVTLVPLSLPSPDALCKMLGAGRLHLSSSYLFGDRRPRAHCQGLAPWLFSSATPRSIYDIYHLVPLFCG